MSICSRCHSIYNEHNVNNINKKVFTIYKRNIDIDGIILETYTYFKCNICKNMTKIGKCWTIVKN